MFQQRFSEGNAVHVENWSTVLLRINQGEAIALETPFNEDEIHRALIEAGQGKALGPERFSFQFAQSFWNLFREDICGMFQEFYSTIDFDGRFTKSFITLISMN